MYADWSQKSALMLTNQHIWQHCFESFGFRKILGSLSSSLGGVWDLKEFRGLSLIRTSMKSVRTPTPTSKSNRKVRHLKKFRVSLFSYLSDGLARANLCEMHRYDCKPVRCLYFQVPYLPVALRCRYALPMLVSALFVYRSITNRKGMKSQKFNSISMIFQLFLQYYIPSFFFSCFFSLQNIWLR
jgi:hypothetical protein